MRIIEIYKKTQKLNDKPIDPASLSLSSTVLYFLSLFILFIVNLLLNIDINGYDGVLIEIFVGSIELSLICLNIFLSIISILILTLIPDYFFYKVLRIKDLELRGSIRSFSVILLFPVYYFLERPDMDSNSLQMVFNALSSYTFIGYISIFSIHTFISEINNKGFSLFKIEKNIQGGGFFK